MDDISNFSFVLTPPSSVNDKTVLHLSFKVGPNFDGSSRPWAMIHTADGFGFGGVDVQTTDFVYDPISQTYSLNYEMAGTAADGEYSLREINLTDKSGNRIIYTSSYFDPQSFDYKEILFNPFADNEPAALSNFTFSVPVFNSATNSWDINASYDASDATGIVNAEAYLSLKSDGNLWGPRAYPSTEFEKIGTTYNFKFSLPFAARSGDYSLLYIVTDGSYNNNYYIDKTSLPYVSLINPYEDTTPPVLESFSIKGEFKLDASGQLRPVLQVTGKFDVSTSGNSSLNFLLYYPDYTPQNGHYIDYFLGNGGDGSFSAEVNLASPSPDGIYRFELESIDNAGNIISYVSDNLPARANSVLLSSQGFPSQIPVYAPDDSYDPSQGYSVTSTRTGAVMFDGQGNDVLTGDSGNNDIVASGGNDQLNGGNGNDIIEGGGGNDSLSGGQGADTLYAGDGNDTVDAGSGDDLIVGGDGAGNDSYNGGDGVDTVKYTSALAGIRVNLSTGVATSIGAGDAAGIGTDSLSGIENVIAGNFNDTIVGNGGDNRLEGKGGNDTIDGGAGVDTAVFTGSRAQYTITPTSTGYTVKDNTAGRDGTDTLTGIEKLAFADQTITLDTTPPSFVSAAVSTNGLN